MKKCQICGHPDNFFVTSFRNKPFIDGNNYAMICCGCAWVPEDMITTYTTDGRIDTQEGPFFDHHHLATPEELFEQGSVSSLKEAKRCVNAVKKKINEAGIRNLNKQSFTRPKMEYYLE